MTLKEAIIRSLEDIQVLTNYREITEHIKSKGYYDFGDTKFPPGTVSSVLGGFMRVGDARVKRVSRAGACYYYLAKNEHLIDLDSFEEIEDDLIDGKKSQRLKKPKSFSERDLHILLSSFLKNSGYYSKTIYHEQSTNKKDDNQIWTHPDMIGICFHNLQSKISQGFFKAINRVDTFKLSSYELKKELNSDSDLKKAFFQTVSNQVGQTMDIWLHSILAII